MALVSTCPWYLKRRSSDPRVAAMVLQHADSEMNFTKTWSSYRSGSSPLGRQGSGNNVDLNRVDLVAGTAFASR